MGNFQWQKIGKIKCNIYGSGSSGHLCWQTCRTNNGLRFWINKPDIQNHGYNVGKVQSFWIFLFWIFNFIENKLGYPCLARVQLFLFLSICLCLFFSLSLSLPSLSLSLPSLSLSLPPLFLSLLTLNNLKNFFGFCSSWTFLFYIGRKKKII